MIAGFLNHQQYDTVIEPSDYVGVFVHLSSAKMMNMNKHVKHVGVEITKLTYKC